MKKHTANFTPPLESFGCILVCLCGCVCVGDDWQLGAGGFVHYWERTSGEEAHTGEEATAYAGTQWRQCDFFQILLVFFFGGGVCLSYFLFPPLALKQHVRARDEVKPVLKRRRRNTLILLGCYWTFKSTRPARPQLADLFSRWARRFLATDKAGKKTIRDDFIHFIWTLVRKQDGMLFAVGTGKKSIGIVVVDQNICLELELIL